MILLGNFLIAIGNLLHSVIFILIILLVARAVLSWVNPDPRNMIVQFIYNSTEPLLSKAREKIPPVGMLDLSVIVVLLMLYFIDGFLVNSMVSYGEIFKQSAVRTVGM